MMDVNLENLKNISTRSDLIVEAHPGNHHEQRVVKKDTIVSVGDGEAKHIVAVESRSGRYILSFFCFIYFPANPLKGFYA